MTRLLAAAVALACAACSPNVTSDGAAAATGAESAASSGAGGGAGGAGSTSSAATGGGGSVPCTLGAPCSTLDWAKRYGGAGDQAIWAVAFDPAGDVIVVGDFTHSIDFGAGPLTASGSSLFVAKLAGADGTPIWSRSYHSGLTMLTTVACDGSGAIYFKVDDDGHRLRRRPDLRIGQPRRSSSTATAITSSAAASASRASPTWRSRSTPRETHISPEPIRNGTLDLGLGSMSADDDSAFVAKFDGAGSPAWVTTFGGTGARADSVAVDDSGDVFVTGLFQGTTTFGATTLTAGPKTSESPSS